MNVTLTFNVFFGPLAIAALVGCGSMKNYEFSQIDNTIELEQNKLYSLQDTLAHINSERQMLGEFLDYANSPSGKQYLSNAQCKIPAPEVIPSVPKPALACEAQIKKEKLTGECSVNFTHAKMQNNPNTMVETIAGLVCIAGPGNVPKILRIPTPVKLVVTGSMRLARSLACASTLDSLNLRKGNQTDSVEMKTTNCDEKLKRCKNDRLAHLQRIEQATINSSAKLSRCKAVASKFPGLNRHSAQSKFNALENRNRELVSHIETVRTAILEARALKLAVNSKYQGYQEYTPPDPG